MILADTNVWVDHLRRPDPIMVEQLRRRGVLMHPYVLAEVALGNLGARGRLLAELGDLLELGPANHDDVMRLIATERVHGMGLGYVDVHLLASVHFTAETRLWTRDKRLRAAAERLDLAASLA